MGIKMPIVKNLMAFIFLLAMILLFKWYRTERIKSNYRKTIGTIVYYSDFDAGYSHSLKYEYFVEGKAYTRTITPSVEYTKCNYCISCCERMEFIVLYDSYIPYLSLINLHKYYDKVDVDLAEFE